ncbi:MAG: DUF2399 domain-containing protein [Deltaproteobacteria bacterium]|nr:DUF2399 domain-containing protein [Deltaproteobacteria bacterium]
MDFLEEMLSKVARRYSLKMCLSGTMKLGEHLDREQMVVLANFFGLPPLRVNNKEEVRLIFKDLLQNGSESQWLEKIGDVLGYSLQPQPENTNETNREATKRTLASLVLAYPELYSLFSVLQDDDSSIRSIFSGNSEKKGKRKCFTMAELISFLLHNKEPITVSDLGAQFFKDSKTLRQGELRTLLIRWLRFLEPESASLEEIDLLSQHHILHDRLTVNAVLYGPIVYEKSGKTFDWIYQLYQQGETATVGWSNIQDIDKIYFKKQVSSIPDLITCENEAPFSNLIHQKKHNCLLFTSGFPSSTVQKLYQLLAPLAANCYHWGDSDPAGLRIAAIMYKLHPLQLYRCDVSVLQKHKKKLHPLTQQQKNDILNILVTQPNFPFSDELLFTLENGWLEQEGWQMR